MASTRLSGLIATALTIGGIIGQRGTGFLADHLGYNDFFYVFEAIAVLAAIPLLKLMSETGDQRNLDKSCNEP